MKIKNPTHVEDHSVLGITVIIQDLEQKLDTGHVGNGK